MQETLFIISGLIGGYFLHYVQSYMEEKGKNLATKEDISDITQKIESVKASLQVLTQVKTDFEQQRRLWLLSFYDSAVEVSYDKFHINFGDLPYDDGQALFEFQQSFRTTVASMVKQYQRIVIYFAHEHPLRIQAEKVLKIVIEAEGIAKRKLGGVKLAIAQEKAAMLTSDREKIAAQMQKTQIANKDYWDEMGPAAKKFRDALGNYLSELNRFLQADAA